MENEQQRFQKTVVAEMPEQNQDQEYYHIVDPPQQTHQAHYEETLDQNPEPRNHLGEENEQRSYISLGTRQARQLQAKAKDIVRLITSEPLITSGWQFPLRAGPEAIAVMATCLVASSRSDSKRIQLTATRKDTGLPLMPFTGLQTNLQNCSDLGRTAFDHAQICMGELQEIAAYTIDRNGTISSIIGLLNDPEDAKYGLRPELDALKASAEELKQKAEDMEVSFVSWRNFIMDLKLALLEQRDDDLMEQEKKNTADQTEAQKEHEKSAKMVLGFQKDIQHAEEQVKNADVETDKAMMEYYKHLDNPPPRQYSIAEVKAQMTSPENPIAYPGLFPTIKNVLFGKSNKAIQRDAMLQKDRLDEDARRVTEALKEMATQFEKTQDAYRKKAESAERNKDLALDQKQKAEEKYNQYVGKMFDASQAVNIAKANLDRLKDEKVELGVVRSILEDSANQLGILVSHIQNLKEFFTDLTKLVKVTNDKHLDAFLRTIDSGIERGGQARNAQVINNIKLGDIAKMKLLQSVLEIQGRFSAIRDISSLYIDVSKRFIRPGINHMDALAFLKPEEYQNGLIKFDRWLEDARSGISGMARAQNVEIKINMVNSVDDMTKQAIEWW